MDWTAPDLRETVKVSRRCVWHVKVVAAPSSFSSSMEHFFHREAMGFRIS